MNRKEFVALLDEIVARGDAANEVLRHRTEQAKESKKRVISCIKEKQRLVNDFLGCATCKFAEQFALDEDRPPCASPVRPQHQGTQEIFVANTHEESPGCLARVEGTPDQTPEPSDLVDTLKKIINGGRLSNDD